MADISFSSSHQYRVMGKHKEYMNRKKFSSKTRNSRSEGTVRGQRSLVNVTVATSLAKGRPKIALQPVGNSRISGPRLKTQSESAGDELQRFPGSATVIGSTRRQKSAGAASYPEIERRREKIDSIEVERAEQQRVSAVGSRHIGMDRRERPGGGCLEAVNYGNRYGGAKRARTQRLWRSILSRAHRRVSSSRSGMGGARPSAVRDRSIV